MSREPSLHIKLSDFKKVLELSLNSMDSPIKFNVDKLAEIIIRKSAPYSVSTRSAMVTNDRVEKKVNKITNSSRLDSDLFSELIYAIRKRMKHRGISRISPNSKDWDTIKTITSHALNFCMEFDLPKRKGFITYIEIGLTKINKFSLNKFLNLYEAICETYIATKEVDEDNEPEITKELYNIYSQEILKETGIFEDFTKVPEKYVWFVRAREQAKQLNVALDLYIYAQFEALDFANGIPYPSQLVGPKATERIYKYLYKRRMKIDNN